MVMDGQERRRVCMNGRNLKDLISLLARPPPPTPPGPFSEEIQFDQGSSSEPRICSASQHLPPTMYFYKYHTFYTILAETVSSELAVDCKERYHFAALEENERGEEESRVA